MMWAFETTHGVWIYVNPAQISSIVPNDSGFTVYMAGKEKPYYCRGNIFEMMDRVAGKLRMDVIVFDSRKTGTARSAKR